MYECMLEKKSSVHFFLRASTHLPRSGATNMALRIAEQKRGNNAWALLSALWLACATTTAHLMFFLFSCAPRFTLKIRLFIIFVAKFIIQLSIRIRSFILCFEADNRYCYIFVLSFLI